jgi:hypothetical protein
MSGNDEPAVAFVSHFQVDRDWHMHTQSLAFATISQLMTDHSIDRIA